MSAIFWHKEPCDSNSSYFDGIKSGFKNGGHRIRFYDVKRHIGMVVILKSILSKAKIKDVFTRYTVAIITYYVKKIIITCSPCNEWFDTIIFS